MGKVSEMLKADLHPSKIDANRLYNNAYLFGIGFGFELDEKYGFILTLDVFKVNLTKTGHIIADSHTSYSEEMKILNSNIGLAFIYNIINNKKISPYIGIGVNAANMQFDAEGYRGMYVESLGAKVCSGINKKISRIFTKDVYLNFEANYIQQFGRDTHPNYLSFLLGLSIDVDIDFFI
jgi:outer membrane protein W